MRFSAAIATALGLLCALVVLAASWEEDSSTTVKKKKAKSPARAAAPVNSALRAASLKKVADWLEDPPEHTFTQPAGLVPVFEQLFRLGSHKEPVPVHMLHFGDSH